MKKLLYALLVMCLLAVSGVYIFIPGTIVISNDEELESSERVIAKYLSLNPNRSKWWPVTKQTLSTDSSALEYEASNFTFKTRGYNFQNIFIENGNLKFNSIITWDSSGKSLMRIRWKGSFKTSYNPIKRANQYVQAFRVKKHMTTILKSLLTFVKNSRNVYGLKIERETVRDTILATSTVLSILPPETPQIYKQIQYVQKYIKTQQAKQVNAPMLNVYRNEHQSYQTVIAVPINKLINPGPNVLINRMVPGNILVTQIKGGPHTIEEGFNQLKIYLNDFNLISPAMPFESLVTNRLAEPDTSKWVTRLYYPIF